MNIGSMILLALLAEGSGVLIGIVLYYLFDIKSKRLIGMLFGTTSGIMIAMICFDVLPHATKSGETTLMIIGVAIGILIGLFLEDLTDLLGNGIGGKQNKTAHTGLMLILGIAIHNIPEGIALGTLGATSPETIMQFAFVMCIHSIPEAIAIAIPLKAGKTSGKVVGCIPLVLGGIMAVGAGIGYVMSQVASDFITVVLGLAAGIILYIVCEELIPESRKIWNGRMTTVATIIGIILGMLLIG
ncbi:ZIP family metal transporter [Niameybacter massiliensis]|uniref:ZIP family metal transporter n=1 Tax=Holtiella tumoricola TaxID=3018743 RepID=A0AA42J468_9FIRM|nr:MULTISPECIES: ZIP family metal transporter [Lachnospirales]MDA3734223.1 ZIP family metal transporter [Holtiella tumoricola]